MTGPLALLVRFACIELLRDRAAWITTALLGLACIGATWNGLRWADAQRGALAEAQAHETATRDRLASEGEAILAGRKPAPPYWLNPADVRGFAYYEMVAYAIKPPAPAAALTVGSSDVLPSYVRVTANSTAPFAQAYELENPRRLALGRVDPTFVVIFLLPLAIAALGYDTLASDRASGRLALLALHGVASWHLVAVRLAARLGLVTVVCLATILAPFAWSGDSSGTAAPLVAWFSVTIAYALLWTAVTAAVVTRASRPATAAAALGALWVAVALVTPWTLAVAAGVAFPPPSRVEQILNERSALDRVEAAGADAIDRYVLEHPEMAAHAAGPPKDTYTAMQIAINGAVEATLTASDERLEQQLARRQALVDSLSWLSPPVLAAEAMVDLAGAGWRRHRAFLQQGRAYVSALRGYSDPRALRNELVFRDWYEWPQFEWEEPSFSPAIRRMLITTIGLVTMAAALFAWAWQALTAVSIRPGP